MLHHGVVMRWAPRYFGRRSQPFRRDQWNVSKGVKRTPSSPSNAAASAVKKAKKPHKSLSESLIVNAHADIHDSASTTGCGKVVQGEKKEGAPSSLCTPTATVNARWRVLTRSAELLLSRLHELDDVMLERRIGSQTSYSSLSSRSGGVDDAPTLSQRRDALHLRVKTEIFGVLRGILPPARLDTTDSQQRDNQDISASRQQHAGVSGATELLVESMAVIPDDAVDDVASFLHDTDGRSCTFSEGNTSLTPPVFDIRDVVVFLQLYHALECEDGALLLQLLQELRRIIFASDDRHTDDVLARKHGVYKDAIPQLLLVLSSLGVAEEAVLQRLTCVSGSFLTSSSISHYEAGDLFLLLIAFHRFGFHHEPCFKKTIKALRYRAKQDPLKSFVLSVLAGGGDTACPNGVIPRCMHSLTLSLLLEGVSAIALSLHRDKAVVELIAATVSAAVQEEEEMMRVTQSFCSTPSRSYTHEGDLGVRRTLQVHRAAKLCEQMELMQPVLADLLHRLSFRHGGLIVQGGEDALSPERVGFYDAITADLVKVSRA